MSQSNPEQLWAFVDDGGLVCGVLPGLGVVPLVTNRRDLLEGLRALARIHAITHGRPVSLARYRLEAVEFSVEPDGSA